MIGIADVEALENKYEQEKHIYQGLAEYVKGYLSKKTRQHKLICTIEARAKEVDSLVKKAYVKNYTYEQIKDKAGVRLIATFSENISALEKMILNSFDVIKHDQKQDNLKPNELGYIGIHFEVRLSKNFTEPIPEQYDGMICEIQLHTQAQNLWSTVSHKLLYKPNEPPSEEIQTNIYHLSALAGIFDNVVKNVRKEIFSSSLDAQILSILEKNFYRFRANQSFNRELSLEIVKKLKNLLSVEEKSGYEALLNEFVIQNKDKLEDTLEYFKEEKRFGFLLSQPETLLILERLEKDKFALRNAWSDILPLQILQDLASAWGSAYRD